MVLSLRTWRVEKILLEIYRFNVSTDYGVVLKMHFAVLKIRFMPTAPIQIVWYIRTYLTVLRLVNVFLIWNIIYIRVPLISFKRYHHPYFDQLIRLYSFTWRFYEGYKNMVHTLSTWRVEKILLEIYLFNVSTDFVGVLKMHLCEVKFRFMPAAPIHIVWYIRDYLSVKG
jgi:hypothetical protein